MPECAKMCQELSGLPEVVQSCQDVPEGVRMQKELPGFTRGCLEFSGSVPEGVKMCQELSGHTRIARACQELAGVATGC